MCEGWDAFVSLGPVRSLLNSSRARACRGRRFAKSFLNLVVCRFRGFSNILLVRLAKWFDQIESLRVADTCERFQQAGTDSRRVVRSFEKGIKHIGAFQLREITNRLVLASGIELIDNAIQRFRSTHSIQGPIERKSNFPVL